MKVYISIFLFLFVIRSNAQTFKRTYGFGVINEGKCVIQTSDHGYAIAGSTTPGWGGQTDCYLVKTDSFGNAEFHYSYGSLGVEKANAIVQLPDSGFILAGYSNGFNANNDYNAIVVRTDKSGNQLWIQTLGTSNWDFIYDMKLTPDGNVVLAGESYGFGQSTAGYVLKVDLNGSLVWEKHFTYSSDVTLNKIFVNQDGSMITCGKVEDTNLQTSDGYLLFLDSNGDSLSATIVDDGFNESLHGIAKQSNGEFVFSGESSDTFGENELILRTSSTGNILCIYTITDSTTEAAFYDITVNADSLVTIGVTQGGSGGNEFHIGIFNSSCGYEYANTHGGNQNEIGFSIITSNDGYYVFVGTSTSFGPGTQSVFLMKTDARPDNSNVTVDIAELDKNYLNIFPNPSNGIVNISLGSYENARASVTDITGKIILQEKLNKETQIEIQTSGIYFLSIQNESLKEVRKIIIN